MVHSKKEKNAYPSPISPNVTLEFRKVAQMVKNLPAMQETWVLIARSGRSPGEGNGKPPQYSCLDYSMDRRAGHGIA